MRNAYPIIRFTNLYSTFIIMKKNICLIIVSIFLLPLITVAQPFKQQNFDTIKVVCKGALLIQVSKQFAFAEGPATDKKGNIYFTDQPNDKIWEYDTQGKLSVFMNKTGRSNGMYFDSQGNLVSCADAKNEIWSISPQKKVRVLLNNFNGLQFNGPNDLWIDKSGGIYFTDPYYQRDYWVRKKPALKYQAIYYLPKGKTKALMLDSSLMQPNGIVGTPDGKYLYVADIQANKTYRYQINKNRGLYNRMLFATQGSDGMTLDEKGNVYLCGNGVTIYDSTGIKLGNIPVPAKWVGNICFGGKAHTTLFITASESIYTLQMVVKGIE